MRTGLRGHRACVAGLLAGVLLTASCTSVGPKTITRDHFSYDAAIALTTKRQLLGNIVGLRYTDAPVFLRVSSVINQYSLEGEISAGGGINNSLAGENSFILGGAGRWSDRPTITYTPLSGKEFATNLLTPISVQGLFGMLQTGWPPELIFPLTVLSINGHENADPRPYSRRTASPEFKEVTEIWAHLRKERVIGVRLRQQENKSEVIFFFRQGRFTEALQTDFDRFRELLDLDPEASEFRIVAGLIPSDSTEIAIVTSSIFDIMGNLAWRFEAPPEHIQEGRTLGTFRDEGSSLEPLIRVQYAKDRPEDAYAAIQNRDYWFYIDDRDMASKRTFGFLQIVLSLAETGEGGRGPLVSISN
ncbi:MAG: hypothetical protein WBH75_16845 [Thermoanaerobaculia bacterium]